MDWIRWIVTGFNQFSLKLFLVIEELSLNFCFLSVLFTNASGGDGGGDGGH